MLPRINSFTLDVTESCNFACDYCFTYSDHKANHLDINKGKEIISWFFEHNKDYVSHQYPLSISWWGGEPLVKFDTIKELTKFSMDLSKEYNQRITFSGTTNGYLMDDEKIDFFLQYPQHWLFSLDGIKESHDFFRKTKCGKDTHAVVLKNLLNAKKRGLNIGTRASIAPQVVKHYAESVKFYHKVLEEKSLIISPVTEYEWDDAALEIVKQQLDVLHDYMKFELTENEEIIEILRYKDVFQILENGYDKSNRENPCGAGMGYVGISVDGCIFPCHRFNKHGITLEERLQLPTIIGKIENGKMIDLNTEFREKLIKFHTNIEEPCAGCDLYKTHKCNGGCMALNYDKTGSCFIADDNNCRYIKTTTAAIEKFYNSLEKENLLNVIKDQKKEEIINSTQQGCICYNGCYLQNTPNAITHIDNNSAATCHCYNMKFQGNPEKSAYQTKYEITQNKLNLSQSQKLASLINKLPPCLEKETLLKNIC